MKKNNVCQNVNAGYVWIVNTDFFPELGTWSSILYYANFQKHSKMERMLL